MADGKAIAIVILGPTLSTSFEWEAVPGGNRGDVLQAAWGNLLTEAKARLDSQNVTDAGCAPSVHGKGVFTRASGGEKEKRC